VSISRVARLRGIADPDLFANKKTTKGDFKGSLLRSELRSRQKKRENGRGGEEGRPSSKLTAIYRSSAGRSEKTVFLKVEDTHALKKGEKAVRGKPWCVRQTLGGEKKLCRKIGAGLQRRLKRGGGN